MKACFVRLQGKGIMKPNKQTVKQILNALLIAGTFAMVLYFAFQSGDITKTGEALRSVNPWWLLGGLGCFTMYVLFEGGILQLYFRLQGARVRVADSMRCGLIGMYYSAITPAATGGQPMQVFSMKKRGVSPGLTGSALAVKFFCWQCALLLSGAVAWALNTRLVADTLQQGIWMLRLGFFLNGIAVAGVILLAVSRNTVRALIVFFVNLAHKLRIIKDKAKTASKFDAALNDFHASVNLLTQHPFQFLVLFLLSLLEVLAMMSAIYFVYRGLGLNTANYVSLVTMQTMLFIAASFTPLPGASGAQEGGFYLFFGSFFPENIIFAAMFVWRFVTYYLSIICGFAAVLYDGARVTKAKNASDARDGTDQINGGNHEETALGSAVPAASDAGGAFSGGEQEGA